jgi:hypothetical protein
MSAIYPDLDPPKGWTASRHGMQIRLSPPEGKPPALIIVSPVIGKNDRIPPPAKLLEETIAAEGKAALEITDQSKTNEVQATSGLQGASIELTGYVRPDQPVERRIYVMYSDARAYYGVTFLAPPAGYDEHAETFRRLAASVRPITATP